MSTGLIWPGMIPIPPPVVDPAAAAIVRWATGRDPSDCWVCGKPGQPAWEAGLGWQECETCEVWWTPATAIHAAARGFG
jgi:hypothetical protein